MQLSAVQWHKITSGFVWFLLEPDSSFSRLITCIDISDKIIKTEFQQFKKKQTKHVLNLNVSEIDIYLKTSHAHACKTKLYTELALKEGSNLTLTSKV